MEAERTNESATHNNVRPPIPPLLPAADVSSSPAVDTSPPALIHQPHLNRCLLLRIEENLAAMTAPDQEPSPSSPHDEGLLDYSDSISDYSDSTSEGGQCLPITFRSDDGQVWVRKDYRDDRGLAPLCYVATGYRGAPGSDGDHHQGYLCYNKHDIQWARRLKFHLKRFR